MYVRNSSKFGKEMKIINPGELYASDRDEIIGTLLGSCVAVCLFDPSKGISGMNHFMLPGRITHMDIQKDRTAKYGITAINGLLAEMTALGAKRENLIAKIFGGGEVLNNAIRSTTIPADNIRIAKVMMEMEDIQIAEQDVGSNFTRKLLMDVKTGKVYLKRSTRGDVFETALQEETEYARRLVAKK
jgi:chemotaxis protein CheD